jgi:hypothetical protein
VRALQEAAGRRPLLTGVGPRLLERLSPDAAWLSQPSPSSLFSRLQEHSQPRSSHRALRAARGGPTTTHVAGQALPSPARRAANAIGRNDGGLALLCRGNLDRCRRGPNRWCLWCLRPPTAKASRKRQTLSTTAPARSPRQSSQHLCSLPPASSLDSSGARPAARGPDRACWPETDQAHYGIAPRF